jgi:hypothetical protein
MRKPLGSTRRGVFEMIKVVALFAALIGIGVATAHAEVVEVPLTGLLGVYTTGGTYRTAYVQLDRAPTAVHSIRIRFLGESTVRDWYCDLEDSIPIPVKFYAEINDPITTGLWFGGGSTPEESGEYQIESAFYADHRPKHPTPSWDFLIQYGSCLVSLEGAGNPASDLCQPYSTFSDATVASAILLIDAEFPVPVEETSWGRIKALYESP